MQRHGRTMKATALQILDNLIKVERLARPHYDEAERVLSLGLPLARMIDHKLIARLSADGQESLDETADSLTCWVAYLTAHPTATIREWWDAYEEAKKVAWAAEAGTDLLQATIAALQAA